MTACDCSGGGGIRNVLSGSAMATVPSLTSRETAPLALQVKCMHLRPSAANQGSERLRGRERGETKAHSGYKSSEIKLVAESIAPYSFSCMPTRCVKQSRATNQGSERLREGEGCNG